MNQLLEQLKTKNPDLKHAEIEGLLNIVLLRKETSLDDLIMESGLPRETLKNFKKSISNLTDAKYPEKILLMEQGRALLDSISPRPYKWRLFVNKSPESDSLVEEFKQLSKNLKINVKRNFDQFIAVPETSVSKALVIKDAGLLTNKKIALLGDDDSMSVSLSILGGFSDLAVIDIDKEVLAVAEVIKKAKGIDCIHTHHCDLRKSLKTELLGNFDVVIIDPPYTKSGVTLFLNRAVQLLGYNGNYEGKYIFLYYGNSFKSPEKTLKIQQTIDRFNLIMENRIDKFSSYNGAESIGNTSALYMLKTTKFTKPLDEKELSVPIYTYENLKEEKFPFVSHFVCKVFGLPKNIINSRSNMLKFLGQFCDLHKLRVVDKKETKFRGNGFSFTFILSNSNLLAHTWPEYSALHIDLVTCSPIYNKEKIGINLAELFKAGNVEVREIE